MVKSQVDSRLGPQPRSIQLYARQRDKELRKKWKSVDFAQFVRSLKMADLIILGDFHAYYQSQRSHVRLLRTLDLASTAVFCEFLRESDQVHIDRFLNGKISESRFVSLVDWSKNWEFPWEHYRPLLLFLKESKVKVFGLSGAKAMDKHLKLRDKSMAQLIQGKMLGGGFKKAVVIVGDMHIAASHLPAEIMKQAPKKFSKMVRVFQDDDDLYFKHSKPQFESQGLILKRENSFCWYVSPPWVKWQSYLMFLEQTADRDLEDEDDLALEDHIKALVLWIAKDFDHKISLNFIDVITPGSPRVVKSKIPSVVLRALVQGDRSFLWDARGKIYLSRTSVNHGSALAGQYIHAQLSHRQKTWFVMPDDVFGRLWIETIGFFYSKWINPQRKAEDFESLKIRMEAMAEKKAWRDTLKVISEFYLYGHKVKRLKVVKPKDLKRLKKLALDPHSAIECCRYLGRIFGRNLFDRVRAGDISRDELSDWLVHSLESEDFEDFFWKVVVPRLI